MMEINYEKAIEQCNKMICELTAKASLAGADGNTMGYAYCQGQRDLIKKQRKELQTLRSNQIKCEEFHI